MTIETHAELTIYSDVKYTVTEPETIGAYGALYIWHSLTESLIFERSLRVLTTLSES